MKWVDLEELKTMELGFNHGEIIVPYLLEYVSIQNEASHEIFKELH